jgi:hypothetical protein
MSEMPGAIGQMPPFPISMNEENLNLVFQLNRMVSHFFPCTIINLS